MKQTTERNGEKTRTQIMLDKAKAALKRNSKFVVATCTALAVAVVFARMSCMAEPRCGDGRYQPRYTSEYKCVADRCRDQKTGEPFKGNGKCDEPEEKDPCSPCYAPEECRDNPKPKPPPKLSAKKPEKKPPKKQTNPCNFNDLCEKELKENKKNCPSDCVDCNGKTMSKYFKKLPSQCSSNQIYNAVKCKCDPKPQPTGCASTAKRRKSYEEPVFTDLISKGISRKASKEIKVGGVKVKIAGKNVGADATICANGSVQVTLLGDSLSPALARMVKSSIASMIRGSGMKPNYDIKLRVNAFTVEE
jgi:hypothetical protein